MDEDYEFNAADAKAAINTLIWMYSPPNLTLGEADERAHAILRIIEIEPQQGGDHE